MDNFIEQPVAEMDKDGILAQRSALAGRLASNPLVLKTALQMALYMVRRMAHRLAQLRARKAPNPEHLMPAHGLAEEFVVSRQRPFAPGQPALNLPTQALLQRWQAL